MPVFDGNRNGVNGGAGDRPAVTKASLSSAASPSHDFSEPKSSMPGAPDLRNEQLLIDLLRGKNVTAIASYVACSEHTAARSVMVVADVEGMEHKYVQAWDRSGREFVVVMPLSWIHWHREILERLETAYGDKMERKAGGRLNLKLDGSWDAFGVSELGRGQNDLVREYVQKVTGDRTLFKGQI